MINDFKEEKEKARRMLYAVPPRFWCALITSSILISTLFIMCSRSNFVFVNGIEYSFPVSIYADGSNQTLRVNSSTVRRLLTSQGIVLSDDDYTIPDWNATIKEGDNICVYRVSYYTETLEEVLPFQRTKKESSLLHNKKDKAVLIEDGKYGFATTTYKIRVENGLAVSSEIVTQDIAREPIAEKTLIYAPKPVSNIKEMPEITIVDNVPSSYKSVINNAVATGYYAKKGRGASGLGLYAGTVAVNPDVIPYGSKLYIASDDGKFIYGFAVATDTGRALSEGIIDIDLFFETYKESQLCGKKLVNIYVIE